MQGYRRQPSAYQKRYKTSRRKRGPQLSVSRIRRVGSVRQSMNVIPPMVRRGAEKKYFDVAVASYSCSADAPARTLLNGMDQGSTALTRIGNKINMDSIQVKGLIMPGQDTVTDPTHVRIMIVYDKQPNGAVWGVTDLLTSSSSNSFRNMAYQSRFKVIYDKTFAMGGFIQDVVNHAYDSNSCVRSINIYKKLPADARNSQYTGAGAGIATINTGSLYMLTISNVNDGTTYVFNAICRLRYYDY